MTPEQIEIAIQFGKKTKGNPKSAIKENSIDNSGFKAGPGRIRSIRALEINQK